MLFDRRFILALALCAVVIIATQVFFPATFAPVRPLGKADSTSVQNPPATATGVHSTTTGAPAAAAPSSTTAGSSAKPHGTGDMSVAPTPPVAPETLTVETPHAQFQFSNIGATPLQVTMHDYAARAPGTDGGVQIVQPGEPLLTFRAIVGSDTLGLDHVAFQGTLTRESDSMPVVTYTATVGGAPVTIVYTLGNDLAHGGARLSRPQYLWHVRGSIGQSAAGQAYLLIGLPTGLRSFEADTADDHTHLAYTIKPTRGDATSFAFGKLDPGESKLQQGPITWAAVRDKYFVCAVLASDTVMAHQAIEVDMMGGPRLSKVATRASALLVQPLTQAATGRTFAFDLYMGPQEWRQLRAVGRDFENVNPYGGIFRVVLQPLTSLTIQTLLWMKAALPLSYGWILVIFGVVVRLILWPFNQSAMRSSLKMQAIQPELSAIQKRYANDATKLQAEMMRVYREHGMSPLSPLAGCLPMVIPMPIFFALIFVFQNTIEFRGVPFLWLRDLSVHDPYFIVPVVMGLSMFLMSWIGMRNAPPNPQAKMMGYMFPIIMTVFLARLAAGVNLYYAVQNIAAIPQQWLLARARKMPAKATG